MSHFDPSAVMGALRQGPLSFPATHARADFSLDQPAYRRHIAWLRQFGAAAFFPASGTGEFAALTRSQVGEAVACCIDEVAGAVPVIAPAGYGTASAIEMTHEAWAAGADGILLFPPYLVSADPDSLAAHVRAVCRSSPLGVIVYHREGSRYTSATLKRLHEECPNLIAVKDGLGDVMLAAHISSGLTGEIGLVGGTPTAEMFAAPFFELGMATYSSAIYNFLPEWACAFHDRVRARDAESLRPMVRDFLIPYVAIRDRHPAYAVSIVKAAMRITGRPAGPVRPPFVDLSEREHDELKLLIDIANQQSR